MKKNDNPRDIILKPVITEKTMYEVQEGKYVFKVSTDANKVQVRHAVEKIFKVKAKDVNIINYTGKTKRYGRYEGRTPAWKKAVVTLRKGDKITDFFEGA